MTFIKLEHDLANIMSMQEASGFRFDVDAAEKVRDNLSHRFEQLKSGLVRRFFGIPGDVCKTPKRPNKTKGLFKGCPYCTITEFNPTSRVHIAHVLKSLGVSFDKRTESGQIKIDEDVLVTIQKDTSYNNYIRKTARRFALLLKLQKWLGQLSQGTNSWFNKLESDGCIHHSCVLATQTGRNAHRNPNLGQVVSAPWARKLFVPHLGQILIGADLEGLELRCLGHFLAPFDNGRFADIVINGDIHQINADSVGCTRKQVKSLTYAFIYGAGNLKLGSLMYPHLSEGQKQSQGRELRQRFLNAIPGLEPLITAVKEKIRTAGRLTGLDGRPIFCSAEHAGLNYLLQSAGAVISKRWVVISHERLTQRYQHGVDFSHTCYVHDEIECSVRPEIADEVIDIIERSAGASGEFYNFRVAITASGSKGASWQAVH